MMRTKKTLKLIKLQVVRNCETLSAKDKVSLKFIKKLNRGYKTFYREAVIVKREDSIVTLAVDSVCHKVLPNNHQTEVDVIERGVMESAAHEWESVTLNTPVMTF